ncbi:MAG TPA: HEAT repeat domain-containing protein [Candidatus Caenarcaniphilales bacterium]
MLEPSPEQPLESGSRSAGSSAGEPLGESLTVAQAIANLHHEDLSLRYYAAWWLGKFRVQDAGAIDALMAALEDEADRTQLGGYPLRRNAARALGKLADRRAVPRLIQCLDCADFYVREAAAQSLGMLGDPASIPALMKLLTGGVAVAQFVPGRPHLVQPYEAVLEALGALEATQSLPLVQPFLEHPVARVQYAATRAMYQLTQDPIYGERLVQALAGDDLKLRRSALADLGAIGYLPAAEAIAQAVVENSFKLMALKGLLVHARQQPTVVLSESTQRVMTLMDTLL